MRSTIGKAAALTVSEPDKGTISIHRYGPEAEARLRSLGEAA